MQVSQSSSAETKSNKLDAYHFGGMLVFTLTLASAIIGKDEQNTASIFAGGALAMAIPALAIQAAVLFGEAANGLTAKSLRLTLLSGYCMITVGVAFVAAFASIDWRVGVIAGIVGVIMFFMFMSLNRSYAMLASAIKADQNKSRNRRQK